eukprot:TRINITY_DN24100_c0_g2_i1.p1 TRINITY_DN24100_c0_g2~~TRINITY_DN24100_c0_g2_i1.p1  ORF type:complete len:184 (+),score=29.90 TRINITY_DN24100_c0_g2_i1:223-774(+)
MLDVAHYFNKTKAPIPQPKIGQSTDEVNCVPHYDPGLLSISFFSDSEGLELQDANGNWVPGPVNTVEGQERIGVLWLGEGAVKASKNPVKAGIHRVVYPEHGKPRLTAWYEMCTVAQATEREDKSLTPGEIKMDSMPGSAPIVAQKGDSVNSILQKIERKRGIPMSKIMRFEDWFKSSPEFDD